jgi:hypothetical protein
MATTELRDPRAQVASGAYAREPLALPRQRRWAWSAGFVIGGVVLFAAYLKLTQLNPVNSDWASNALQAWDMLHGNPLLRGWTVTDVSFYTTELPEYMLVELVRGLNASAAHIAAALTYTLVVIGAALVAKGRAGGREGVVRALTAAGLMLAPTIGPLASTSTLLADPDHTGTQVPLLVIWLILDRARPRWWVPALVGVLLTQAQVADPLVTYEGVLPILVVCAIRVYRQRGAHPRDAWRECWFEISLAAGAALSVVVAAIVMRLIREAGGFAVWPTDTTFSVVQSVGAQVWVTVECVLNLFGADFSGMQLGPAAAIRLVHLAGLALVVWAVARALRHFASGELVVQVLVVAAIVLLVAISISGAPSAVNGTHEIVGLLPIGAVLAGRLLAGRLIGGRHLVVLGVLLACSAGFLGHDIVQSPPASASSELAVWLGDHHLDYGLATYWSASSVTLDSGGLVQVRPVNRPVQGGGRIDAVQWESKPSWYDPGRHDARFLIVPSTVAGCSFGTHDQWLATVHRLFGPPAASYRVARLLVLVWHRNLLPLVSRPVGSAC